MNAAFRKAFRDSRRTVLWLSIALALYALFVISFYPSMVDQEDQLKELIESYPPELMSMFTGGMDVGEIDLTAPGTFLQSQFTIWAILILGAVVAVQIFNGFTNAERDNSMDMMLSLPISRRQLFLARVLNTTTGILIILTVCFVTFWISSLIWSEFEVTVGELALGMYGMFFPIMVIAGLTYLLVSVTPSSKNYAGAIVYLFMIGSYLVYTLASAVEVLKGIQPFFIFHYYNTSTIMEQGLEITDWLILSVASLALLGAAWWFIDKKELGV